MTGSIYIEEVTDNAAGDIEGKPLTPPPGKTAFSFQMNTTGLDAADSEMQLQESNDGTNWINSVSPDLPIVFPIGDDVNKINIVSKVALFYRLLFTSNTTGTGEIEVILSI